MEHNKGILSERGLIELTVMGPNGTKNLMLLTVCYYFSNNELDTVKRAFLNTSYTCFGIKGSMLLTLEQNWTAVHYVVMRCSNFFQ